MLKRPCHPMCPGLGAGRILALDICSDVDRTAPFATTVVGGVRAGNR